MQLVMKSEQFYLSEFIRKLKTVSSLLEVMCFLPMHPEIRCDAI